MYCGYCLDAVARDDDARRWVHTTDAPRVAPNGPGDLVSDAHNRAGTYVNPVDIVDSIDD